MFSKISTSLIFVFFFLVSPCCNKEAPTLRRFGQLAVIHPDCVSNYKELHAAVWPEVLEALSSYHIHNYSIHLKELEANQPCLFGYYEYTGRDYSRDMEEISKIPSVQKWGEVGDECMTDISPDGASLRWIDMEELFYHAGQNGINVNESKVQRHGMVIRLRSEMVESYRLLHKYTWSEILNKITECNIRNYSIYLYKLDEKFYLFSYWEYIGNDFEADMALMDNDPATVAWMKFTDEVCQMPIPTRDDDEWWAVMEEIFFHR